MHEGIYVNVFNITGPGSLYKRYQAWAKSSINENVKSAFEPDLINGNERNAPIITVIDGHSHSLSWIGSALGMQCYPLGVTTFGQSGDPDDLYAEYGLDSTSISATCFGALGL